MTRWSGWLVIAGCVSAMCGGPVEAKDHSVAKSLTRTGLAVPAGYARACARHDLLGNWDLVAFDSPYRFRNPQAPYLFPYQVFQYSHDGGVKSAHSLRPMLDKPGTFFEAVPSEMTYQVERNGRLLLKTKEQGQAVERWSCEIVTQDRKDPGLGSALQRGDLIMTLVGTGGQPLFVRHLRKSAA